MDNTISDYYNAPYGYKENPNIPKKAWRPLFSPKGVYVVIGGIDGVGKTTQVKNIVERLENKFGKGSVATTFEPGATKMGKKLRHILLDKVEDEDGVAEEISMRAELLGFAADNAQHMVEVVMPNLVKGKIVISDRGLESALCYQGIARGWGHEVVRNIYLEFALGNVEPDGTYIMNLPWQDVMDRIGGTGEEKDLDRMESQGTPFLRKVWYGYHELAKVYHWALVDARGSIDSVAGKLEKMLVSDIQTFRDMRDGNPW